MQTQKENEAEQAIMLKHQQATSSKPTIALQASPRHKGKGKKKKVMLQAEEESSSSSSDEENELLEGIALFNKRINYLRLRDKSKGKKFNFTNANCFECDRPGHLKKDCPLLKKSKEPSKSFNPKYKYKKKALKGTWDESESEDSDDGSEMANFGMTKNMALMANDECIWDDKGASSCDEEEVNLNPYLDDDYDELAKEFSLLHEMFDALRKEHKALKKAHALCESKINEFSKKELDTIDTLLNLDYALNEKKLTIDVLAKEKQEYCDLHEESILVIEKLKREVLELEVKVVKSRLPPPPKTTRAQPRRNAKRTSPSHSHRHTHSSNNFGSSFDKSKLVCTYCSRRGHVAPKCRVRDNLTTYGLVWIPKGTIVANPQGPNFWVPKTKAFYVGGASNEGGTT